MGVGDVFANNIGDSLYNTLLDVNCCEAGDVLSVGFVLGVTVGCDLWFDDDGVGTAEFGGHP